MGKYESPIFSHLWTKIHEVLGDFRGPFVVTNAVLRLSVLCSMQIDKSLGLFPVTVVHFLAIFFSRHDTKFLQQFVSAIYHLAKFGCVMYAHLPCAKPGNDAE